MENLSVNACSDAPCETSWTCITLKYLLLYAGHLQAQSLGMFRELERIARVSEMRGRGWYGVRRIAADVAEDVEQDERVLNSITGHRDSTTRRLVYQDRQRPAVLNKAAATRNLVRQKAVAEAEAATQAVTVLSVPESKTA